MKTNKYLTDSSLFYPLTKHASSSQKILLSVSYLPNQLCLESLKNCTYLSVLLHDFI